MGEGRTIRDREGLLRELVARHERVERVFRTLDDDALTASTLENGWTAKDLLAHFGAWQDDNARNLATLRAGGTPESPAELSTTDAANALFHEQHRGRRAADVRRFEEGSFRRLREELEAATDEDLFDPQRFAWMEGKPYVDRIMGEIDHYHEHRSDIERVRAAAHTREPA